MAARTAAEVRRRAGGAAWAGRVEGEWVAGGARKEPAQPMMMARAAGVSWMKTAASMPAIVEQDGADKVMAPPLKSMEGRREAPRLVE